MVPKARAETLSPLLPIKRISIKYPSVFNPRGSVFPPRASPVIPGEWRRNPANGDRSAARFAYYDVLCSRPPKLLLGNHVVCALCFVRGQGQRTLQDLDRAPTAPETVQTG